jgi:2-amino-4-hydroxy-6-hydroxymethyldihydropteridine diphosphokinase
MPTDRVFIALGSNLGDSRAIVGTAMDRLDSISRLPVRRSSLWTSTPVDCPPGSPPCINAVVAFVPAPGITPEDLLASTQAIEKEAGRVPKHVVNEARPLDLDLLAWGDERRDTPMLVLPHPRAHLRRFVLEPLAELAPDQVLPGRTVTVANLLAGLPLDPGLRRLGGDREKPWNPVLRP